LNKTKSFCIAKEIVWKAYEGVKANDGGPGYDGQTIRDFEKDLKNNLYKIWNRMSSGSYLPPPVLRVEVPKDDGRMRPLGIPSVSDRIAQMVVKLYLEPVLESIFHPDSYGYRPNKSAIQAITKARQMCWQYDWLVDLDIKGFFDNIDHHLMMQAVRVHTDSKWILLYIERWLKAPVQFEDGTLVRSDKGTPQGGVISPLLANLFLHYAFDRWLSETFPDNSFERYADDAIVHCRNEEEAKVIKQALSERMEQCKLELHPKKTKIVYCKDDKRKEEAEITSFNFLGYTFRMRTARNKQGQLFNGFNPAISSKAANRIRNEIRSWELQRRSDLSIFDISIRYNVILRGWIGYYCKFNKTVFYPILKQFNQILVNWANRKYKKLHNRKKRLFRWLRLMARKHPKLFYHWTMGVGVGTVR
jgi:group II intron reverse transcriptase/maturase